MTIRRLADLIGARLEGGDGSAVIEGIASIDQADARCVTFASDARRAAELADSKAGAAIVGPESVTAPMPLLHVANVQQALAGLLAYWSPGDDGPSRGIDPTATIAADAHVAPDACIGPGAVVGAGARIGHRSVLCARAVVGAGSCVGEDTILFEGAVVRWGCTVGSRCRLGPNSVVGFDGFGYYFEGGRHNRIPHIGSVAIGDDVELGACACVDRAKFGTTVVDVGTKIDNLVQVAHNVQIGKHCVIVAQAGIAGTARLGDYVVLGGGVGVRDNVTLGKGVVLAGHAGALNDLPDGLFAAGMPAHDAKAVYREWQALTRLPELLKKVRELEKRLSALESEDH